jgi:hypothetical protein
VCEVSVIPAVSLNLSSTTVGPFALGAEFSDAVTSPMLKKREETTISTIEAKRDFMTF